MDSLDAQCLLVQLTEGETAPPNLWRHDRRTGALSCAYEGSERSFTWPAEKVAEMARSWRDSNIGRASEQMQLFRDALQRLEGLACEAGLGHADVMIHDLRRGELRLVWENDEVVVVVEEIGESASPQP